MEYIKRSRRGKKNRATRTLLFGVIAGSVLAGAGSYEALAEELDVGKVKAGDETQQAELMGEQLTEEQLKENAEQLIKDIQQGKSDTYLLLTGALHGNDLPEELTQKIESSIGHQKIDEKDTETVKRLKEEQKGLSSLISNKYEDAKALAGVVKGVRDGNVGSGTFSRSVAVNEGEERLGVLLTEIDSLIEIKELIDEDLSDANGIQSEIRAIEEEIRARLAEILGDGYDGSFDLTESGDLSLSGDYLEYLNTLESDSDSYNVRSSFVHQSTKDSKILASYYGQNKQLDALIAEGLQYLDRPYVWGGESLAEGGFDCSGLLYRIFKDTMGINLPRVSQDQQNFGQRIPLDDIQPGDLVFWNTPATHVALYLGDGKIMEAANPTAGLRVRDVRLSELSSATRVHDFGISDNVSVHITNAKRTISYTPVLSREQSQSYNQSVQNTTPSSNANAEAEARVREIERQAREEQARLDKQKQDELNKQKQEEADKKQAELDKKKQEQQQAEDKKQAELEKQKAEEEKKKQEQAELEKQKAEQERLEQERLEQEKAEQERLEEEARLKSEEEARKQQEQLEQEERVASAQSEETPLTEQVE